MDESHHQVASPYARQLPLVVLAMSTFDDAGSSALPIIVLIVPTTFTRQAELLDASLEIASALSK